MGAEWVWQEELQGQKGENDEKYSEEQQEVREVSEEGGGVMDICALLCTNTPSGLIAGELQTNEHVWPGSSYEQEQ